MYSARHPRLIDEAIDALFRAVDGKISIEQQLNLEGENPDHPRDGQMSLFA